MVIPFNIIRVTGRQGHMIEKPSGADHYEKIFREAAMSSREQG
jgi:hypothetical protein